MIETSFLVCLLQYNAPPEIVGQGNIDLFSQFENSRSEPYVDKNIILSSRAAKRRDAESRYCHRCNSRGQFKRSFNSLYTSSLNLQQKHVHHRLASL